MRLSRVILLLSLFTLDSCSLVDRARQRLLGENKPPPEKQPTQGEYVPKEQFDELQNKYDRVSADGQNTVPMDGGVTNDQEVHQIVQDINQIGDPGQQPMPTQAIPSLQDLSEESTAQTMQVEQAAAMGEGNGSAASDQVGRFRSALLTFNKGDLNNSLQQFESLTMSEFMQIKVRALYYAGIIKYQTKSYADALGTFQLLIEGYAESVYAIKALHYAILSAQALKASKELTAFYAIEKRFNGFVGVVSR